MRRLCIASGNLFFPMAMALLGVLVIVAFISFEFAYTDRNHSSKITADHSASGNDVEVTVIWLCCVDICYLHWLEKPPWEGLNLFVFAFKHLGRKAAITECGFGSL